MSSREIHLTQIMEEYETSRNCCTKKIYFLEFKFIYKNLLFDVVKTLESRTNNNVNNYGRANVRSFSFDGLSPFTSLAALSGPGRHSA